MYKATHGTAPSYLSQLIRVADLPGRRSLRSARTNRVLVPSVKLSTVGGRAFPVAGPTIWNSLPDNVISSPSLSTFRQRLKHFCSRPHSLTLSSIPGKLFPTPSGSWSDFITWTTLKNTWLIDCWFNTSVYTSSGPCVVRRSIKSRFLYDVRATGTDYGPSRNRSSGVLYVALNRVIAGSFRSGSGLCRAVVTLYSDQGRRKDTHYS